MKLVKITDGNGYAAYKLKPTTLWGLIPLFGYYWSDGEIGASGQSFKTEEEARKIMRSFETREEIIK